MIGCMDAAADDVVIRLRQDGALVLYELLHRWEEREPARPEHHAEHVALWNLSALLESELTQPFDPGYDKLVSAARTRLRPKTQQQSRPDGGMSVRSVATSSWPAYGDRS